MSSSVDELGSEASASITLEMIPLETTDSYLILKTIQLEPETAITGDDTTTDPPSSSTDTDLGSESSISIPSFPIYGLVMGVFLGLYLIKGKPII
jgi:hypothetical protein